MNEDIDVSEIIRLAQTEFNLSFSFDVSRMQNLFEQLCINIQKLQIEIENLKKDNQNKCDKSIFDPLNDTVTANSESIDDLRDRLDRLSDFCSEKLGASSSQNTENENFSQSRPRSSISNSEINDLKDRLATCEDKIADFDKRLDEVAKVLLSDLPNNNRSSNYVDGPTRHERFEGFLEEFDKLGQSDDPGNEKSGKTDKSKNINENKSKNFDEKETKNIKENEQEINPKSNTETGRPIPKHDDTLDTFLDAAKIEIENAKKLLSDELNQQMKENNTKLNTSINKAAADSEEGLKKANSKLIEAEVKLGTEIKAMSTDNQNQFSQLRENLENLTNKIKALESRLESNTKASEMTKESLKKLVTDDGSIDPHQLFDQLEQQLIVVNDLDGRLIALENREHVSPDAFNTALKNLSECTEKVKNAESMLLSNDMRYAELKENVDELKKQIENQVTQEQITELEKIIHELQEESTNLREAIIKNNKDIVNVRAAINTLRGNSEETRSIAEDAKYSAKQACDDVEANDKRVKKVIVFLKEEIGQISNQIKELTTVTERHDETIHEIQRKHDEDITRLEALRSDEESEEESDEDGTPRPKTSKNKQKQQQVQPIPTISTATSPHLPSLSSYNFEQQNDNQQNSLIPNAQSQQQQQKQIDQTQIVNGQMQQSNNDQQQVVTVVRRKQTDTASSSGSAVTVNGLQKKRVVSGGLPRLVQQQAKREIEGVRMDLKRYEDLIPRVERLESSFTNLRSIVDPLNKQSKLLTEQKADRSELQNLFEQFRMALGELNNRLGGVRKIVASKADIVELKEVQRALFKELAQSSETAAGTEIVRCLMCGQPRTNVTGAIDDPTLAKAIGNAVSSRVCGADGQGNVCFVYGEHGEMYQGRSADGKPIYSKMFNSEDEGGNATGRTNNNKQGQAPMTAPMMSRKVMNTPNSQ